MPLHILIRNVQAEIAKCCHWSMGDGTPDRFFLAVVQAGPDELTVTQADGQERTIKGLRVEHDAFPNDEGVFLPIGITVVAGFEAAPSFYLEPRTGLMKPGEDVIFSFNSADGDTSTATNRAKQASAATTTVVIDTVRAIGLGCQSARQRLAQSASFLNNAYNTKNNAQIETANAKVTELADAQNAACTAAQESTGKGQECITAINVVVQAETKDATISAAEALTPLLEELLALAVTASVNAGSTSARAALEQQQNRLAGQIREIKYSGTGAFTKCEFFISNENIAQPWNAPEDGTLPCNGVRTDCSFYTGEEWLHATEEKTGPGKPVLAQAIQELRWRSDDWTRFPRPEEEFKSRFALPFLWAFKRYVPVGGQPEIENMLLYRPKVLFGRDTGEDEWETVEAERVAVTSFGDNDTFEVETSTSRITPGSEDLDRARYTDYPSLINSVTVPSNTRLKVTHPKIVDNSIFTYRTWSPDKNTITLFGTATPGALLYIVNQTALTNRARYHAHFETVDFADMPSTLPGLPNFTNITATELESTVFGPMRTEQSANANQRGVTPLGYDEVSVDRTGFWSSFNQVELVHNTVNELYVILVAGETLILSEKVSVDYRFMHSIVTQTSFRGLDWTMHSTLASSMGALNSDVTALAEIKANAHPMVLSRETPRFAYGYYGLRFKDRSLRFSTASADNDLKSSNPNLDDTGSLLVTTAGPSTFINSVGYNVVQYRKEFEVEDWYVVNDCGWIMIIIDDPDFHRVLPLPNQQGENPPLTNVLVNGGGTGSVIAQFALEKAEISVEGVETKPLVQFYRDPDGLGLPANYILMGPHSAVENAFGRPEPGRDSITVTATYLRAQSTKSSVDGGGGAGDQNAGEAKGEGEVVSLNFHKDNLRTYNHSIQWDSAGDLIAGGSRTYEGSSTIAPITSDQQEYVWVFADSTGRPIGRKYTRFLLAYYNIACLNVEIMYAWTSNCEVAALIPDLFLAIGGANGEASASVTATTDTGAEGFSLGFRVENLVGSRDCRNVPNCGDHEFIAMGPLLREFEVISNVTSASCDSEGNSSDAEDGSTMQKAIYVSAGQPVSGQLASTRAPGSQYLVRRGPLWYPYTTCERPRYSFTTNGPLHTDSTELINSEGTPPGVTGAAFSVDDASDASSGCFEGLEPRENEAYRAVDRVTPKILDVHPTLRPCTSAFTYGNQITRGGAAAFSGYARIRGELDLAWYEAVPGWEPPPFTNIGRAKLMAEVTSKRGDYLGGPSGKQLAFRWMPMFPEREDLGSSAELFGEDMEPQSYRLLCTSSPLGGPAESVDSEGERYTQKGLIHNRVGGAIEYPYVPYYPSFLPDGSLGQEPENRDIEGLEGDITDPITTMWAWREQESFIKRARQGSALLAGVQLDLPSYFIDNRRMEVRMRPDEGVIVLEWKAPTFKPDGTMDKAAELKLGLDGPPREIEIDFVNRRFGLMFQPDTVYDTTKGLNTTPFPCENGTKTDNLRLGATCQCIENIQDESLDTTKLPSRLLHLDELAPDGYFALYENDKLNTPFGIDSGQTLPNKPRLICVYYIRGIYFRLNANFIPSNPIADAAFDERVAFTYTWSRVPHGYTSGTGVDNRWGARENMADGFIQHREGAIHENRFNSNITRIDLNNDDPAVFPSVTHARQQIQDGRPISVLDIAAGDPQLKGGRPATDGESQGETERIILTVDFPTYVRIEDVTIDFVTGEGWEAPKYSLIRVEPSQIGKGSFPAAEGGQLIGTSVQSALESSVPGSSRRDADDIRDGRYRFSSKLTPGYADQPFWNQYGKRFHLDFPARGNAQSMGIASIKFRVLALVDGFTNTEIIDIPERRYYRSSGSPGGQQNPEQSLAAVDSCSAYWNTVEATAIKGANRHRAYAWGNKKDDSKSEPITGTNIGDYERYQFDEYETARSLFGSQPYIFQYRSYIPRDEADWLEFLREATPSWQCQISTGSSNLDLVTDSRNEPIWKHVPFRQTWNPTGHAWTWTLSDEEYNGCCFGCPSQQIIDYQYLHLHDSLAVVETARFWDELPSGFTRLMRSTLGSPDPRFGQSGAVGGGPLLIPESAFRDSQGNPISAEIMANANLLQNDDGSLVIVDRGST